MKKISSLRGENPISRQLSSLSEGRGENFCCTSHISADSWGKNVPPVIGKSTDKTARVRFLSYSRLAGKCKSLLWVCQVPAAIPLHAILAAWHPLPFPTSLPMCKGKFVFSPCSLQQRTSFLYLKTTVLILCAQEEKEQPRTLKCHSWGLLWHSEILNIFCTLISP